MPGICGNNVAGASTTGLSANGLGLIITGLYLAVAGDVIDQFFFYGHDGWTGGGNADFALYDVIAGLPANRVHIPVNIVAPDSVSAWQSSASGLGIALVAGTTYCIAQTQNTAGRIHYDTLANCGSENNGAGLPASWTHNVNRVNNYSMYANIIAGASPAAPVGRPGISFDPIFGDF